MESSTKNRQPRDVIERMAQRAFGVGLPVGDDAVVELTDGWFNVVYLVRLADDREVVLKIAPPSDAETLTYERNIMETEVATMRLVARNPLVPVPEVYAFDQRRDLCDGDYFFMERLTGDNLERASASLTPDAMVRIRERIGRIIQEINGFCGTYFGYPGHERLRGDDWRTVFTTIVDSVLGDGLRRDVDYGFRVDEIRDALERHAPALDSVTTPRLVHWDAWDPNFLVRGGEVTGLVDFERALWADPLMEAQFRPVFGEATADLMRGYGRTAALTHDEQRRCHLYTLHLALVMKTECAYRNYDTDHVDDMATALLHSTMEWLTGH